MFLCVYVCIGLHMSEYLTYMLSNRLQDRADDEGVVYDCENGHRPVEDI